MEAARLLKELGVETVLLPQPLLVKAVSGQPVEECAEIRLHLMIGATVCRRQEGKN